MERKQIAIVDLLQELSESELLAVNNTYCNNNRDEEGIIYKNIDDNINEQLSGMSPYDLLTNGEKYDSTDKYFKVTIYGIKSFDNLQDEVCIEDLSKAILRDETILTDVIEIDEYETELRDLFEYFLYSKGIEFEDGTDDLFSVDDIISSDWEDLLEEAVGFSEEN